MNSREVVLDIETQNFFPDVGEAKHKGLKISVVGCYFYETDSYECFEEAELGALWSRLERAGRLIGYNTIGFDYLVMNNYYAGDFLTFPSLDILLSIQDALGFRLKLDDVAHATLGSGKTAHGFMAIEWWKRGEIQKIKDYCLADVRITKELYEFGKRERLLKYLDHFGRVHEIPVDFSEKQAPTSSRNLTLGF
jgi:DEAD/DEAH box helicase domain-containing protein